MLLKKQKTITINFVKQKIQIEKYYCIKHLKIKNCYSKSDKNKQGQTLQK